MHSDYTNITNTFADFYLPRKGLLMYEHVQDSSKIYLESYDCNEAGTLVNAHPLSQNEIETLADILQKNSRNKEKFLMCDALLPENLLYLNPKNKCVIWHTSVRREQLYFSKSLHLQDGIIFLPALIWKATDTDLSVFAIKEKAKPKGKTMLFHAPFFNIYEEGRVCMGTVDTAFENCGNVEEFISLWQQYFFNSHFSHTLGSHATRETSLESLYTHLLNNTTPFPEDKLVSSGKTLQHILP